MLALLQFYNYKEFFSQNMNGLRQATAILDHLIMIHFPDLSDFLSKKGVSSSLFAIPWFNTLFSYDNNKYLMIKTLNLFIYDGWKILFQLSLSILK